MSKCLVKLFATLSLLLMIGCSAKPYAVLPPLENDAHQAHNKHLVYVVSHGWHTGFVLSAEDIRAELPDLKRRFPKARHIEIGWGDRGFYQSNEITTGLTLRAIFWPTESVVHAVAVPDDVLRYFSRSDIATFFLNDSEYASLIRFISNSFERNKAGEILPQKNGLYGDSQFYTGVGDYYLMNTCNKWTAKGLKSAGLNIAPMFKLTASSIMNYLEDHNAELSTE